MKNCDGNKSARRRFVRNFGVIGFGFGMGTLATIILYNVDYGVSLNMLLSPRFLIRWVINLTVFIPGGYLFGVVVWFAVRRASGSE